MYSLYCLILVGLFSINISRKGTELYVGKTAHGSHLLLPRSFRQASCCRNVKNIPTTTKFRGISILYLICGDFNMHVDTTSKDSEKFLNYLESHNINQHVQKPTYLHGHILDLILTPDDSSVVSNVRVSEFISDHGLVLGHLDFTKPSIPTQKMLYFGGIIR